VGTSFDPSQALAVRELCKRKERWEKRALDVEAKDGNFGILGIMNLCTE
jgi:hypothetical protein